MTPAPRTLIILCAALSFAACQAAPQRVVEYHRAPALSAAALVGNWDLIALDGVALRPGVASLNLQPDGRFVATVYCNYAKGVYVVQGRSMSFDGWDATERGCNEEMPRVDRIEDALRGDGYTFAMDTNGDLLLIGPAQLRLRRARQTH